MIALEDVPELLALLTDGQLTEDLLFGFLVELSSSCEIDVILSHLPDDRRRAFEEHLRSSFDNDSPADRFITFSSATGATPIPSDLVQKIRAWLQR